MLSGKLGLMEQRYEDPHSSSTAVLNFYVMKKQMQAQHKPELEGGM
jgi:hypothetical protein